MLAGTEFEMGNEVWTLDAGTGADGGGEVAVVVVGGVMEPGGGTCPPERKDGHKERSSGKEADEGERCERIAAA